MSRRLIYFIDFRCTNWSCCSCDHRLKLVFGLWSLIKIDFTEVSANERVRLFIFDILYTRIRIILTHVFFHVTYAVESVQYAWVVEGRSERAGTGLREVPLGG